MNVLKAFFILMLCSHAVASPGAHGPNGEHLSSSSTGFAVDTPQAPSFEAFTDQFELIGKLYDSELSIFVSDYATNAPILGAEIEVEVSGVTATATYHADAGDYAFDAPELMNALTAPGEYALVFTVIAGDRSDLLDAQLLVTESSEQAHHDHHNSRLILVLILLVLILVLFMFYRRKRARS